MGEAASIINSSCYGLDHSKLFDVHKVCDTPGARLVLDGLCAEVAQFLGRGKLHKRSRQHLGAVVLDLYAAWSDDPTLYVAYPRGRDYYGAGERMHLLHFDRDILSTTVNTLEALGYLESHIGFYERETSRGRWSRMRATDRLAALFMAAKVASGDIERRHDELYLRAVKDDAGKKADMVVPRTRKTDRMRRHVRVVNTLLRRTAIRLDLDDASMAELVAILGHRPDPRRNTVFRVFNDGKLNMGGRFYGHWVQGLPCLYRRHLTINGEPATEYDFSGMHIRLLYAMAAAVPPAGDMYHLPNMGEEASKAVRPILKVLLLAAINAKTDEAAISATQRQVRLDYGVKVSQGELHVYLAGLREHHAAIADKLGSGAGLGLQFADSTLAEAILLDLAAQDIPAVPIHDSFLAATSHGPALVRAMNKAWTDAHGVAIGIDAKF